jgi:cysteine synthase B
MPTPLSTVAPPFLVEDLARVGHLIGKTPLYRLRRFEPKPGVEVYAKLEWYQLGGSVKARPAYNMLKQAILGGQLREGQTILDATSGNTGIALAAAGRALGFDVTLCLPENASTERKLLLKSLGAELILTSRLESTDGAQRVARELYQSQPERYYYTDQYKNPANWQAHVETTAREIFDQTAQRVTHFVAGLGTTGTFVGTTRGLKMLKPTVRCVALQPDTALHGLEGWKHLETALVPAIWDPATPDDQHEIDTTEAYALVKLLAEREGLLVSPSAGANLAGALRVAQTLEEGVVVTVFSDSSDKYTEVIERIFS